MERPGWEVVQETVLRGRFLAPMVVAGDHFVLGLESSRTRTYCHFAPNFGRI